ncbi:hypothetical protein F511_43823 [Dorcoceras hygrometricum]|uniref:Uncharacterized protein n=1 Tax=Dorcoceras hygrometricum TaxID=472368 RepID=A0A2Z7CW31_9LAMI|nr:hypothetical protein F511_43823 [Dorcoceras hygrometricum]
MRKIPELNPYILKRFKQIYVQHKSVRNCASANCLNSDYDDVNDYVITAKPSADLARRRFLHCYVFCCQLLVQHCSSAVNGSLNSDCQQIRQQ